MGKADVQSTHRSNKTICLPFSQQDYNANVNDPINFRKCIDDRIKLFPELFPSEITNGYQMKDIYLSKKRSIMIRRIQIDDTAYTIRPSYLMPYLTGIVDEIDKALFMRKFNVPFWGLSYAFGKDPMYWYAFTSKYGIKAEGNFFTKSWMLYLSPFYGNLIGKFLQLLSVVSFVGLHQRLGNIFLLFIILLNCWAVVVNSMSLAL